MGKNERNKISTQAYTTKKVEHTEVNKDMEYTYTNIDNKLVVYNNENDVKLHLDFSATNNDSILEVEIQELLIKNVNKK